MIYSDYDIYYPGGKTAAVVQELSRAKQEIAAELGISPEQVQLDVSFQIRLFLNNSFGTYLDPNYPWRNPPTKEQLLAAIQELSAVGKVHLDEIEFVGAKSGQELEEQTKLVCAAAIDSERCDSLTFWATLRFQKITEYDYMLAYLFNPDYTPSQIYKNLLAFIIQKARERNLV